MTAPVPNGEGDGVVNPKAVRVLMNEYDNPITVGRVYRVHEWRKLRGRKGLFPRIYGDDGRTITLDQPSHYEAAELPPLPIHLPETDRIMSGLDDEKCLHTDGAYCGIDCGYCIGNAFDALVRERDDALARANTATVAADLMRDRAEKAERFLSMLFESHWDGTIGRPPTWHLRPVHDARRGRAAGDEWGGPVTPPASVEPVVLWRVGDAWQAERPVACSCDGDPEQGPHTTEGDAILEYRAVPVGPFTALAAYAETGEEVEGVLIEANEDDGTMTPAEVVRALLARANTAKVLLKEARPYMKRLPFDLAKSITAALTGA